MLKHSGVRRHSLRMYDNLPTKGEGRLMTGFMSPYRAWMWKQNDLFRNVMEAQFEHCRKVYKRQWFEAFRVNADEYIFKYNQTKAAQMMKWEQEMVSQESQRRDALDMHHGRQELKSKHLDMLKEYYERHFFHWYERASERLQYMSQLKFVKKEEIDAHIAKELDKYVVGKGEPYPLNFVGQMPFLEDGDGNIVEAPSSMMERHQAEFPKEHVVAFTPQASSKVEARKEAERRISGDVYSLDEPAVDEQLHSSVTDEMAEEEARARRTATKQSEVSDAERAISRQKYVMRGAVGSKRANWKSGTTGKTADSHLTKGMPIKKGHPSRESPQQTPKLQKLNPHAHEDVLKATPRNVPQNIWRTSGRGGQTKE